MANGGEKESGNESEGKLINSYAPNITLYTMGIPKRWWRKS